MKIVKIIILICGLTFSKDTFDYNKERIYFDVWNVILFFNNIGHMGTSPVYVIWAISPVDIGFSNSYFLESFPIYTNSASYAHYSISNIGFYKTYKNYSFFCGVGYAISDHYYFTEQKSNRRFLYANEYNLNYGIELHPVEIDYIGISIFLNTANFSMGIGVNYAQKNSKGQRKRRFIK